MRAIAVLGALLVLGLAAALVGGCGNSPIEAHTVPTLLSINGGAPVHADVWDVDTTLVSGGTIPEEAAVFLFSNPPSQEFLDISPEDPYGIFTITSYRIDYTILQVLSGGGVVPDATLPSLSGSMHLALPVGSETEVSLVLAPASLKMESPLIELFPDGSAPNGEIVVRADISFLGRENGQEFTRMLQGSATLLFANYADED